MDKIIKLPRNEQMEPVCNIEMELRQVRLERDELLKQRREDMELMQESVESAKLGEAAIAKLQADLATTKAQKVALTEALETIWRDLTLAHTDSAWIDEAKGVAEKTLSTTGREDAERTRKMEEAIREFVERCERGEIKSRYTYAKFKEILEVSGNERL